MTTPLEIHGLRRVVLGRFRRAAWGALTKAVVPDVDDRASGDEEGAVVSVAQGGHINLSFQRLAISPDADLTIVSKDPSFATVDGDGKLPKGAAAPLVIRGVAGGGEAPNVAHIAVQFGGVDIVNLQVWVYEVAVLKVLVHNVTIEAKDPKKGGVLRAVAKLDDKVRDDLFKFVNEVWGTIGVNFEPHPGTDFTIKQTSSYLQMVPEGNNALIDAHYVDDAVNMYCVPSFADPNVFGKGLGPALATKLKIRRRAMYLPQSIYRGDGIRQQTTEGDGSAFKMEPAAPVTLRTAIAHELGHYLDLEHPYDDPYQNYLCSRRTLMHNGVNLTELVNQSTRQPLWSANVGYGDLVTGKMIALKKLKLRKPMKAHDAAVARATITNGPYHNAVPWSWSS